MPDLHSRTSMRIIPALLALFVFSGCAQDRGVTLNENWQQDGARFFVSGVDTSNLFRNLETLEDMGLALPARNDRDARNWIDRNLRRELVVLYRHAPEVVDSLYRARVTTLVEQAPTPAGGLSDVVSELKRPAERTLLQAFRQPSPMKKLGIDIQVPFPDSLKARLTEADIRTQVAIDAEGRPLAVRILEPVHPVLETIAVNAIAQQQWNPAYVLRGRAFEALPVFVRYNVLFR